MEKIISKLFKIRYIGGGSKTVGFSLLRAFRNELNWKHGDTLRGTVDGNKLIIEKVNNKNVLTK